MEEKVIDVFFAFTRESEDLVNIARKELEYINNAVGVKRKIVFRAHDWITCSVSGEGNPEGQIMKQFPAESFSIFVGIFRFNFGKPTKNLIPGTDKMFESGMEEEFYYAWKCKKENGTPEIMIYKSAEKMVPRDVALQGELKKIDGLFREFQADGKYPVLYKEYENESAFTIDFRNSMFKYFLDYSDRELEKNVPKIGRGLSEKGYLNIFINDDNDVRNKLKREEIKKTTVLRLHAKSCHAFLARGIVFYEAIRNALARGMEFKIIMQNPWSLNSLYLSLNEEEFSSKSEYKLYQKHRLESDRVIEIFEKSHWYQDRFLLSIKGYRELHSEFRNKIELRVCDMDASNSIFLSDNCLFFEPYINTVSAGRKSLSLFEIQATRESELYKDSDAYFNIVWESSCSYNVYNKNLKFYKERLKGYLDGEKPSKRKSQ